jgi:hypothetical protein
MLFALVLAVLASAQFAAVPGFGSALALFPYSFFNASCGVVVTTSSVSVFEQNFSFTAQFNVYDFLSGPGAKATAATAFVTPSQKAFLAIADSKGMLSFSSFTSCSSPFVFEASISGIPLGSGGAFAVRQYGLDMQFISANSLVTIGLVQSTNGPVPGVKRNQSLSIKSFAGAFSSSSGEFYHVEMLRNSHQRILGQNGFSGDFASAENVFSISSVVSNNKNFALFGYANLDGNPRVSVMFANGAKALTLEIAKGRAFVGKFYID